MTLLHARGAVTLHRRAALPRAHRVVRVVRGAVDLDDELRLGDGDVDDAAQPGDRVLLVHRIGHVEPTHRVGHVILQLGPLHRVAIGLCDHDACALRAHRIRQQRTRLLGLELHPALELVELPQVLLLETRGAASVVEAVGDEIRAARQEVAVVTLIRHGVAPRQDGKALGLEQVEIDERTARQESEECGRRDVGRGKGPARARQVGRSELGLRAHLIRLAVMLGDALRQQCGAAREELRRRELGGGEGAQDVDHVCRVESELIVRLLGIELGDGHVAQPREGRAPLGRRLRLVGSHIVHVTHGSDALGHTPEQRGR
mmetsp:Transcript_32626/g.77643  ORF Transcript_32626/g.77643 Transcript_32626/m.77643 type:complete len:317 (-) Transcript_32626:104-1054(-)